MQCTGVRGATIRTVARWTDGIGTWSDGARRLTDGAGRLTDNASRVSDGAGRLTDGASRVTDAVSRVSDGASRVPVDASRVTDGASRVPDDASRVTDGVSRVTESTSRVSKTAGRSSLPALRPAQRGWPWLFFGARVHFAGTLEGLGLARCAYRICSRYLFTVYPVGVGTWAMPAAHKAHNQRFWGYSLIGPST